MRHNISIAFCYGLDQLQTAPLYAVRLVRIPIKLLAIRVAVPRRLANAAFRDGAALVAVATLVILTSGHGQ
jgi:hypothetical protein